MSAQWVQKKPDAIARRQYDGTMVDKLTPERRSWNMSRIRSKDTKPEIIVRSLLHRMGFRFRINRRDLPGKPDIVLPKYKTVVFVHGCFWHRHDGCKRASIPETRRQFWDGKFNDNVRRDRRNKRLLRLAGWRVIVIWECEVRRQPVETVAKAVRRFCCKPTSRPYAPAIRRQLLKAAEEHLKYRFSAPCDSLSALNGGR